MTDTALRIAQELIRRPSITPEDGGCQDYLESLLHPLGFRRTRVDAGGVTNSVFFRPGERDGTLAYAGHTDVVPPGPRDAWPHPPFSATIEDGVLHGRGAQDMKGGIACWIAAMMDLVRAHQPLPSLQLLITSDEEGESVDGTIRLVEHLQRHDLLPDAAIVGEPSSHKRVGDTIRRGRRGVVQARIGFLGQQGHSAYPQDADNAIHHAAEALARIVAIDWGAPLPGFPPTTCQITNIHGGTGASNVIPGTCEALLDIRYNPANDFAHIRETLARAIEPARVELHVDHVANAFVTADGPFLDLVCAAIRRSTGLEAKRDTGGGTSDGRFLASAGVPVAELGLTNGTIHQVGECVAVEELRVLTGIYRDIIMHFERHS
ncbi:MAG: succinyl-diaminopimelate desuccinylase [Zetaproteobacteria bacterium]|nr:MAG: succinyl-diaminopimelate desuccinylase [Zetaproteobacteria bacterium]